MADPEEVRKLVEVYRGKETSELLAIQAGLKPRADKWVAAEAVLRERLQNHKNGDGDKWYKKPIGIIVITIVGGLLLWTIKALVAHYWPGFGGGAN